VSAIRPIGTYETLPALVNDWNPRSCEVAAKIAKLIRDRLPDIAPEHIGSTAVPGCAGKGIIDLMIPFAPEQLHSVMDALETLGFQRQTGPDPWPEDRPMRVGSIQHSGTTYRIHVHVVPAADPEVDRTRRFRDTLRTDPTVLGAYIALKRDIAGPTGIGSYDYSIAKGEWISMLAMEETRRRG